MTLSRGSFQSCVVHRQHYCAFACCAASDINEDYLNMGGLSGVSLLLYQDLHSMLVVIFGSFKMDLLLLFLCGNCVCVV